MVPSPANLKAAREDLARREEVLRDRLADADFLANRGLGNEVGIYLFCYDPSVELELRETVARLRRDSETGVLPGEVRECNLYDLALECCEQEGVLHDFPVLEAEEGTAALLEEFGCIITAETIVERLEAKLAGASGALFLTGVGEVYPLVRAHTVLNLVHSSFPSNPVVMFYPGDFNGHELKLFSALPSINYYRAFNIM